MHGSTARSLVAGLRRARLCPESVGFRGDLLLALCFRVLPAVARLTHCGVDIAEAAGKKTPALGEGVRDHLVATAGVAGHGAVPLIPACAAGAAPAAVRACGARRARSDSSARARTRRHSTCTAAWPRPCGYAHSPGRGSSRHQSSAIGSSGPTASSSRPGSPADVIRIAVARGFVGTAGEGTRAENECK